MKLDQLIQACKKKDRKAQKVMVERFAPLLFSICKRYMKNEEDARDVLQDTLVQVFNHMDEFRSEAEQFKGWICRITINMAISKYRKAAYKNELYTGVLPINSSPSGAIEALNVQDILLMMDQLPDLLRKVFNLYVIDGYRHNEIAGILGITESHSRTVLTRARKMMQAYILKSQKIRS